MALDDKKIINLQDARIYLQKSSTNTADDQLLDMLIQHASDAIAKELGVDYIVSTTYREFHDSTPGRNLWLVNYPVSSVDLISVGRDDVMTVSYTNGDASYATVEVTPTQLKLRKRVSGTLTASTFVLTDYATLALLGVAIGAVDGWSTIISTDFTSYSSTSLIPVPGKDARDDEVTLEVPDEGEILCELEPRWGKLTNPYGWAICDGRPFGWKWCGSRPICIEYTAGYERENLPQPLKAACLMMIKSMYDGVKKDGAVKKEKIGDYSYELADRVSMVENPIVQEMLGPYRRQAVFGI